MINAGNYGNLLSLCSCGGVVKHYLVAMNFKKRRMTIDGKDYLDNLYELVEVSNTTS